jgi:hypothetical protein
MWRGADRREQDEQQNLDRRAVRTELKETLK